MSKIIAFGRRKRVGKDTCAKYLKTYLLMRFPKINVQIVGFADKLKEHCYELYSWAGLMPGWYYEEPANEWLKEEILPKLGKSPRQIWIDYGNCVRDYVYEPTWAHYILFNIKADVIIIKDLRFPTEAKYIEDAGGFNVEIENPRIPETLDEADQRLKDYQGWFARINNNDNHTALNKAVISLAQTIWLP